MGDRDGAFKELESIDGADALLASKRYSCFCFPCFGPNRSGSDELSWWERVKTKAKSTKFDGEDHWWTGGIRSLKKLREWSEIVAGPRWKTFIRRFNRNRPATVKLGKFQYDPISYALNFDEGHNNGDVDFEGNHEYTGGGGFQNFSDRFAAVPPAPMKSSSSTAMNG
ncbi:hypothetical protein IC582_029748 [Cucumis melo]|uniref:NHL domain-containing protein n=2 Tax=Cucumis melo TaxID=3656 RepID=A0A5A7ULQ3_CUCMM|nr:uncharacterized protein LOC103483378 [Cucumis melo]KAA0055216.1 uncharacterized protein E6C27_scaffold80G00570 [Cucumis melo var. makuwa]